MEKHIKQTNYVFIGGLFVLAGLLVYFLFAAPASMDRDEIINYAILYFSLIYVVLLYLSSVSKHGFDLFEPITLYTIVYLLLYTITPMVLIIADNTLLAGIDVMGGCVKATIIYMLSYTAFVISYYYKYDHSTYLELQEFEISDDEISNPRVSLFWAYIIWLACLAIEIYYLLGTGNSLSYVLTLGLSGTTTDASYSSNLKFLTDFGYGMIGSWYYICLLSKKRSIKIIFGFITFACYYIRGFRFIIVVMLLGFLIMMFVKNRKTVNLRQLVIFLIGFLVLITVMGATRYSIRHGTSFDWSSLNIFDNLSYTLYSNFNIYQLYYGFVDKMPEAYPYQGFQVWLESLVVWIPRALWANKPATGQAFIDAVGHCMSYWVVEGAAMAAPDLGAYYYSFGAIGCVLYNVFWGRVCSKSRSLYIANENNIHKLVLYCLFMPMLFQMIIRGSDMIGFFKMFIFVLYPAILIPVLSRIKIRK